MPPSKQQKAASPDVESESGDDDSEEEYEVEAILARKGQKGKGTLYQVKWVGFDKPTWEPLEHLGSAQDMVKEFEEERGASKKSAANKRTSAKRAGPAPKRTRRAAESPEIEDRSGVVERESESEEGQEAEEEVAPASPVKQAKKSTGPSTHQKRLMNGGSGQKAAAARKAIGGQNGNNGRSISVVAQGGAAFDHGHQVKAVVAHKPGNINAKVKNVEDLEFLVSYSDDHDAEFARLDQIKENPEATGALIKYLAQLAQIVPK